MVLDSPCERATQPLKGAETQRLRTTALILGVLECANSLIHLVWLQFAHRACLT